MFLYSVHTVPKIQNAHSITFLVYCPQNPFPMQPSFEPRQPNRPQAPRIEAGKQLAKREKKSEIISESSLEKTRANLQKKLTAFEDAFTKAAIENGKEDTDIVTFAAGLDDNYKPGLVDRITGKLEMIDAALEWKRVKTALNNLSAPEETTMVLSTESLPTQKKPLQQDIEDLTEYAELITPGKELGFDAPMEDLEKPIKSALTTLKEAYPKGYNFEDAALKIHIESDTMSEFDLHELAQLLRAEFAKKGESYLYGGLNETQRTTIQANLSQFERGEKQLNRDRAQLTSEDSYELAHSLEQKIDDALENALELTSQIERHVNNSQDYPNQALADEYSEMLDLLNHDLSEAQFFLERLPSSVDPVTRKEVKAKLEAAKDRQASAWSAHRRSRLINTGRSYAGAKSVAFNRPRGTAETTVGRVFPTPTTARSASIENSPARTNREMTDVELLNSLNIPNKIAYLRKEMEQATKEANPDFEYFKKRLGILDADLKRINAGESMNASSSFQKAAQDVRELHSYFTNVLSISTEQGFNDALANAEEQYVRAEKNRAETLGEYMETVMDFQSEFLNRFPGEDLRQVIGDKANREAMYQDHVLTDEERSYYENKFNLINWKAKLLNISFPSMGKRVKNVESRLALPTKQKEDKNLSVDAQLSPRRINADAMNARLEAIERDFLGDSYESIKRSEEKENDEWRIRGAIDRAAKMNKLDAESIKNQYMDALMDYRDLDRGLELSHPLSKDLLADMAQLQSEASQSYDKEEAAYITQLALRNKLVKLNQQLGWPAGLNLDKTRGDVDRLINNKLPVDTLIKNENRQLPEPSIPDLTNEAVLLDDESDIPDLTNDAVLEEPVKRAKPSKNPEAYFKALKENSAKAEDQKRFGQMMSEITRELANMDIPAIDAALSEISSGLDTIYPEYELDKYGPASSVDIDRAMGLLTQLTEARFKLGTAKKPEVHQVVQAKQEVVTGSPEAKAKETAQAMEDAYLNKRNDIFVKVAGLLEVKRDLRKIGLPERDSINQEGKRFKETNESFPSADKAWHIVHTRLEQIKFQNPTKQQKARKEPGKDYNRILKLLGASNTYVAATEAVVLFTEAKLRTGQEQDKMELLVDEVFDEHRLSRTAFREIEELWENDQKKQAAQQQAA